MKIEITYRGKGCNQSTIVMATDTFEHDLTPEQLSWLAGLFDAEGTFAMRVAEQSAVVNLYNNNPKIMEEVVRLLGFGKVELVKRTKRNSKHSDSYQIQYQSQRDMCHISALLLPYLRLKQIQAKLLIQSCVVARCERFDIINEVSALNAKCQQFDFKRAANTKCVELGLVSAIDYAYLAGLWEGDGSVCFQPQFWGDTTYLYPWVQLSGTKPDLFDKLQTIFGGAIFYRAPHKEGWAPKVELRWQDQAVVEELLRRMQPYVKSRQPEIELMLASTAFEATARALHREKLWQLRGRHQYDEPDTATSTPITDGGFLITPEPEVKDEADELPESQVV